RSWRHSSSLFVSSEPKATAMKPFRASGTWASSDRRLSTNAGRSYPVSPMAGWPSRRSITRLAFRMLQGLVLVTIRLSGAVQADDVHEGHVAPSPDVVRHHKAYPVLGKRFAVLSHSKENRLSLEAWIELAPGDDGLIAVGAGGGHVEAQLVVLDIGVEYR